MDTLYLSFLIITRILTCRSREKSKLPAMQQSAMFSQILSILHLDVNIRFKMSRYDKLTYSVAYPSRSARGIMPTKLKKKTNPWHKMGNCQQPQMTTEFYFHDLKEQRI